MANATEYTDFFLRCQAYGLGTFLTALAPAGAAARSSQTLLQQQLALLQTVESIRHHLATHDHVFPQQLSDLELPAPHDPFTGQAFEYARHEWGATLTGARHHWARHQLALRLPESP